MIKKFIIFLAKNGKGTPMDTITQMAQKTLKFFMKDAQKMAKESGFVKRKSKLKGCDFVTTMVIGFLQDPSSSLERLVKLLSKKRVDITKQGLHQRMNQSAIALMEKLLQQALTLFQQRQKVPFDLLKSFRGIEILDSSGISLPKGLKKYYAGYGGGASTAGLKLQTLWDYISGTLRSLDIVSARKPDQGYRGHFDQIEKGKLYLMDLGYFCCDWFQKVIESEAYFVSRFLNTTQVFEVRSGKEIDLIHWLKTPCNRLERRVRLGKKHQLEMRIMAQRVPDEVARKRKRQMRKTAKKKGYMPSKLSLVLAEWTIYLTNVPKEVLTADQVSLVYRLRWQIELLFKLWKSEGGIDRIAGKTAGRVLCEIYAKLIGLILLLYFTMPLHWQETQELSYRKAFKDFRDSALEFFKALASCTQLKKFLRSMRDIWKRFSLKPSYRRTKKSAFQRIMEASAQGALA